jgi:2-polyprenyl-3-methyl-5-hydroxy-6-metoxy-1,4-benzoquinol methylase
MRLDNPLLVQWEYASEERLAKRNAIFRELIRGPNPEELAFAAVAETAPGRVLDVGCGTGEFTERLAVELGAAVEAVDISARMVELTRERGLSACVADVQALPFRDASFDTVSALWVLYHAPHVDAAIAECARVITSSGRLVAATLGENLPEVWQLVGEGDGTPLTFDAVNGAPQLAAHFGRVTRRDIVSQLVFPNADAVRELIAATITNAYLAPRVPDFEGEFRATLRHTIFVAEAPR